MRYAEVCVNSPIARRGTFSYSVPSGLHVSVGQAVYVPFGSRTLQGIIMARIDRLEPDIKRVLQVASVIGRNFPYWVLSGVMGEE